MKAIWNQIAIPLAILILGLTLISGETRMSAYHAAITQWDTSSGPCPQLDPWNSILISAQGYGPGSLRDSVLGLNAFTQDRSPTQFISFARSFISNTIQGPVQVSSLVGTSPPYTFTWQLSDLGDPDQGEVLMDCYAEIPMGTAIDIVGTISRVQCAYGYGSCYFYVHASMIQGQTCEPTVTPEATP